MYRKSNIPIKFVFQITVSTPSTPLKPTTLKRETTEKAVLTTQTAAPTLRNAPSITPEGLEQSRVEKEKGR